MNEKGGPPLTFISSKVLKMNQVLQPQYALPGGDCVEPCVREMQASLEQTPMLQNEQIGQLSFSQLAGHSQDRQNTQDAFSQICRAYVKVDACLEQCEKTSESSARVRQTYAGIRFICVEHKKEFFESLPCLARFEPVAMQECRREINESLVASNRFSTTVMRKEQHNLRNHFESLCRRLGAMIECVEPVTRGGCGDKAAVMMLRFITVGFSSFEQLYSQLGISDQLPASCKSLLSLRRRIPEPRVRTASTKEFEHAPQITSNTESTNLSAIFFLICTIITY
ncbi:hypothetical protein Q1695_010778 [Nippostrongylus brasiliensis]|nr:hypothetical protein Q1695_010778 [Nippostrongylus brasiliensis]